MMTPAVTEILKLIEALPTDLELQDVINRAVTIRMRRLQAARRKAWASQGEAKLKIDSSRERT